MTEGEKPLSQNLQIDEIQQVRYLSFRQRQMPLPPSSSEEGNGLRPNLLSNLKQFPARAAHQRFQHLRVERTDLFLMRNR